MEQLELSLGDKKTTMPYIFFTAISLDEGLRVSRGNSHIDIIVDQEPNNEGIKGVVISSDAASEKYKIRAGHANAVSINPYSVFKLEVLKPYSDGTVAIILNPVPIDAYSFSRIKQDGTIKEINLARFTQTL